MLTAHLIILFFHYITRFFKSKHFLFTVSLQTFYQITKGHVKTCPFLDFTYYGLDFIHPPYTFLSLSYDVTVNTSFCLKVVRYLSTLLTS